MDKATLTSILIIALVAAVAPMLSDQLSRWLVVPSVVLEVALGVLVGPAVLDWARDSTVVSLFAQLGLAFLMFLAGYEIRFRSIRGAPLRLALRGWLLGLPLAALAGLAVGGVDAAAIFVGLSLATTALGTILPIVRDAGWLTGAFGARVLAVGAIGEFGPIVAVALLLTSRRPLATALLLASFGLLAVMAAAFATHPRPPHVTRLISTTLTTSVQFAIRIAVLIAIGMVWIAAEFGLDVLLGAFAAGLVFRLFMDTGDEEEARVVESKLDAIGFGLLIPIFFVVSGLRLDLDALLDRPSLIALVPLFLLLFLVVRSGPTMLVHRHDLPAIRDRRALALLAASALPLVVVITALGVESGELDEGIAAAMVTAAMVSILIYPLLSVRVRRQPMAPDPAADPQPI